MDNYLEKTCPVCGKVFRVPQKSYNRLFCSGMCKDRARREKYVQEHPDALKPTIKVVNGVEVLSYERTCPICGKVFEPRSPGRKQKYCGEDCRQEAQRANARKRAKKSNPKRPKQAVYNTPFGSRCTHDDCAYKGKSVKTCDFMLLTGERRGCPADDCTRYKKRGAEDE